MVTYRLVLLTGEPAARTLTGIACDADAHTIYGDSFRRQFRIEPEPTPDELETTETHA